ncbi:MAG: hypothetical protein EB086_13485 [Rhodobacteraceae bacterium]|nr:hypothetical protein [Paracoccaceae bacterium]
MIVRGSNELLLELHQLDRLIDLRALWDFAVCLDMIFIQLLTFLKLAVLITAEWDFYQRN